MFYGWDTDTLMFWGAIVLIILISSYFKHSARIAKYRMMETLAEKGQTLSPELLRSLGNGRDERRGGSIQSGVFLICIGIALAIFFWAMTGAGNPFIGQHVSWLPVIGIFPFMIGVARVIAGVTDARSAK